VPILGVLVLSGPFIGRYDPSHRDGED
jgi:hypothetical protein